MREEPRLWLFFIFVVRISRDYRLNESVIELLTYQINDDTISLSIIVTYRFIKDGVTYEQSFKAKC